MCGEDQLYMALHLVGLYLIPIFLLLIAGILRAGRRIE